MSELVRIAKNYLARKGKLKLAGAIADALEAKDQRIAELTAGINRAGGLALQKASHDLIRQVLAETLASEDTRKETNPIQPDGQPTVTPENM